MFRECVQTRKKKARNMARLRRRSTAKNTQHDVLYTLHFSLHLSLSSPYIDRLLLLVALRFFFGFVLWVKENIFPWKKFHEAKKEEKERNK